MEERLGEGHHMEQDRRAELKQVLEMAALWGQETPSCSEAVRLWPCQVRNLSSSELRVGSGALTGTESQSSAHSRL